MLRQFSDYAGLEREKERATCDRPEYDSTKSKSDKNEVQTTGGRPDGETV